MGRMSRNKGAAFEREIAIRLSALLGRDVKRRLGQARDAGHDLDGTDPFLIECKRRARISVYEWYEQVVKAAAGRGGIPMVIMRQDNGEALVLLSLIDFFGRDWERSGGVA